MTIKKLSPDFEERFARISIDLSGCGANEGHSRLDPEITNPETARSFGVARSSRKKTYPSHLYPNGTPSTNYTTPSKQPVLSTAKRAKSRNLSNQLKIASNSTTDDHLAVTPTRIESQNTHKHGNRSMSTVKQPSKRILSCPMSERPNRTKDHLFSFMKETSSSMNKHVNVFNSGVGTSPTPNRVSQEPQPLTKRVSSSNTTKRRHQLEHRTRNISGGSYNNGARERRIMSTQAPVTRPTDITNISYSVPTLKFHEIKSKDENLKIPNYNGLGYNPPYDSMNSPSKHRHVSQPFTQKSKDDVYDRLYNNSNSNRTKTGTTSPRSLNSRLECHQTRNQCSENESNNTETPKIQNTHELLLIIYREDPDLFSFGYTSHKDFNKRQHMDTQNLNSGVSGYSGPLSIYERGEILRKKDIYFMPSENGNTLENDPRSINVRNYSQNFGFDDKTGNYIIVPHDHINYRYEIETILGNGSFGNVVRCKDHKYFDSENNNKTVAIKIIKNDIKWSLQAVYETKMLKHLNEKMKTTEKTLFEKDFPILTYIDHFHFRGHMCIISEMLSLNLYSLLEIIRFRGLSLNLLRLFSKSILTGLDFIHKQNIIHCDIKPENIMIKLPSNFHPNNDAVNEKDLVVKIIDFGSSCFDKEISYSYIQSRFYRAPEVVLGASYNNMIDIWSFGCVIAELFSGAPLLAGKNELEQIGLILELFGAPNSSLILEQRDKLMKSAKRQKAATNFNNIDPNKGIDQSVMNKVSVDEKTIRKTLLFSLFDILGKINLQFLNMRSQVVANTISSTIPGASAVKKKFKPNSKGLEILLRLNTTRETKKDIQLFSKFLHSIFKWNPSERPPASELLNDSFLREL